MRVPLRTVSPAVDSVSLREKEPRMSISSRVRQLLTALGAGYLGLSAWNGWVWRRTRNLSFPAPLDGEANTYPWPGGMIYYTQRGRSDAEPVVLVHGIYAGADSHEWRGIFEGLAERYQVYAYDLLGFGHSAHPYLRYSGPLYVRLLIDFLRAVVRRPATVVASSLSGGHAIRAASEAPDLIRRLILEAPTGQVGRMVEPSAGQQALYLAANVLPDLGEGLRNLIATRTYIRSYLASQAYYDPSRISDETVNHGYISAHQPGGQYPLVAFLSGHLNVPIDDALRSLSQPISLIWGRQARVTPLSDARRLLQLQPRARLHVMEQTGLDAAQERPQEFLRIVEDVLAGREAGAVSEQQLAEMAQQA